MGKLNQVIAVVAGKKAKAAQTLTEAYHKIQKAPLFDGISRTYQPKDEDGERLPPESKAIQVKVSDLIAEVTAALTEMFDVVATQDYANCSATANVVVDGTTILKRVPVTHLLFLEKQLNDVATFVGKLPTLDPAESWSYNDSADLYATPPSESARTKKVPKAFVKYEATKEHPAQVETFHEDVLAGYWKTIKFSGALPAKEKNQMLERVRQLHEAVVKAREEANSIDAPPVSVGKAVFDFIFR
jgi:hypothetical protein